MNVIIHKANYKYQCALSKKKEKKYINKIK